MIAYFDTSAIVPLLIDEPGTALAARTWTIADRVVSVRLTGVGLVRRLLRLNASDA
ncbi:hypothetical protein BH18ACT2_BH18ACT2_20760 [soil metagenome]